jgi:hypothetical protein
MKNRNCDKESSLLDRLKHENKKLKRQLAVLRRQLEQVDVNKYNNLQQLVKKQEKEDRQAADEKKRIKLMNKWRCFECNEGALKIVIINRLDGVFYFRRCDKCNKRTKLQKYHTLVDGIKEF